MPVDEEALAGAAERSPRLGTPIEERKVLNTLVTDIPPPPASNNAPAITNTSNHRLPIRMPDVQKKQIPPPRLLHPFLHKVPMHLRFGINGFLSNVGFMVAYNMAVVQFGAMAPPSTIYSVVYLIFIPVSHALISLLVFGWPERYISSLMSNAPIGLTAIALGAALTAYLDTIEFNKLVVDLKAQGWTSMGYEVDPSPKEEKGEFYSSLVVLFITGMWTFGLSVVINSPAEPSEKKEL